MSSGSGPRQRRVTLVPHDPHWVDGFARESARISSALQEVFVAVHHIGSTAIPTIRAKPVIDILAGVTDLKALDARTSALEALGYEAKGEFGIPGRRYFRKNDTLGERSHHIHAFVADSPEIARHIAFRDFLISHPGQARRYEALKLELAARFPWDATSYTEGKNTLIAELDLLAAQWRKADADDGSGARQKP